MENKVNYPTISGIYMILNSSNNKVYIGCSNNLKRRLQRHKYELMNNKHQNTHLQRSFNKYGIKNFKVRILEQFNWISKKLLIKYEKEYIIKYDSLKTGYNMVLDSSTHITKLNKSKKTIKRNIKRMSKPVIGIDRLTGKKYKEYASITEAALDIKTSTSNISRVCKGDLNYIKDLVFCYKHEYSNTKCYIKQHWAKGRKNSTKVRNRKKLFMQKTFGITIHKYGLDKKYICTYLSRAEAERHNNLKKESLRRRINIETPFEGNYYYDYKL